MRSLTSSRGTAQVVCLSSSTPGKRGPSTPGLFPPSSAFATRRQPKKLPDCAPSAFTLYEAALELAREEQFSKARQAFELATTACPVWERPWISWAQVSPSPPAMPRPGLLSSYISPAPRLQMERRSAESSEERVRRCREVLQRALALNPCSWRVVQAWGLMELKRGNLLPAVLLLQRCAASDPSCAPVLRWQPVIEAVKTVGPRRKRAA